MHVTDVFDAVAGELQLGDEGVQVIGDWIVIVRTRDVVFLTMTEIVTHWK